MKAKRLLSALLAGALLVGTLAGCGNTGSGSSAAGSSAAEPGQSSPESQASASETGTDEYRIPVLVKSSTVESSEETYVGKLIKDKFNVAFDYEIYAGDILEKTNLQLAGGDYTDIVNVPWDNNVANWIDAGSVLALDDLLEQYGADFNERHKDNIPVWRMASPDGKLYKWETAAGLTEGSGVMNDVWIRSDVLAAMDYPKLVSSDDWIEAIKKGKELFPSTNEGMATEGLCVPFGETWGMALTQIFNEKGGLSGALGGTDCAQWDPVNEKYVDMISPYMKENMQFYNKLWRENLLDKESFTMATDAMTEKMNTGIPIAVFYSGWSAKSANDNLKKTGRPEQAYVPMPIQSPTQYEEKMPRNMGVWHSNALNSWMITDKAKDPARIVEVLNWFATDEGLNAVGWGEEGVHYTVEDGKKVPTQEFIDLYAAGGEEYDKIGLNSFPFSGAPDRSTIRDGQYNSILLDPQVVKQGYSEEENMILEQYGLETFADMWHGSFVDSELRDYYFVAPAASIPVDNNLSKVQEKIVQSRNEFAVQLVKAKDDEEFENVWNQMIEKHNAFNPEEVIQFKMDQLKEMEAKYEDLK